MSFLKYKGLRKGYVYALCDPNTEEIRYVGKTITTPHSRLLAHLREARSDRGPSYKRNWIRSLLRQDETPTVRTLEYGEWASDFLSEREIYWIAFLNEEGCRLTNATKGGDGGANEGFLAHAKIMWTDDKKKAHSKRMREWYAERMRSGKGDTQGSEESKKQRVATRNKWIDNGGREILSAAIKKALEDPEKRNRMYESTQSPERRKKISESGKRRYESLEERAKTGKAVSLGMTDDGKARIGMASLKRHGYDEHMSERPCYVCGTNFMPKRRSKQTCSESCWRAAIGINRKRNKQNG